MAEEGQSDFHALMEKDERHIQHDLARIRDLEDTLRRFHEEARAHPDTWRDRSAAGDALRTAFELRGLDHELHLLYLQQFKRARAEATAARGSGGANGAGAGGACRPR